MTHPTIVTLTGTGVPHPCPGRAGAGTLVRYGDIALQFDAGRGTVIRLAEAGVEPCALTALLITHVHSDHLVDLADVAMTRWIQKTLHPAAGPLTIVTPEGTAADFARHMFDNFVDDIETRLAVLHDEPEIDLRTFAATPTATTVWRSDDGEVAVEAIAVHHEPVTDAVAYRITTPTGVVVISGDTVVCDEVESFSVGCDLLVHEACRATAMRPLVAGTDLERIFSYHADSATLGGLAERAQVPHIMLTHLIPPPMDEAGEAAFVDDLRGGGYSGRITVGRDLTTVLIDCTAADVNAPFDPRAHLETKLDPARLTHLGIWRDEADEISDRFFQWEVPALPSECINAIAAGVRTDIVGLDLSNITDLLSPGYLPLETGIALTPNGELSVATLTQWPDTTPEMIDWWFGWHIARTERYKLWHPQAHYFTQPRYDLSDVPGLTDRERYVGNTSWVDEYLGPIPSRLAITFHDPSEIGLDEAALTEAGYGTVVCAVATDSDYGHELSRLIHAVRHTADGCEMRSRFILPAGTPEFIAAPLLDHCWTEMTHLASFLPDLYMYATGAGSR